MGRRLDMLKQAQSQVNEGVMAALLKPISAKDPAGQVLVYTDWYDRIRAARHEEEDFLPKGVWATPLKKANWSDVATLCGEALRTQTKDLQIVWWLAESWYYLYGAWGLWQGLELVKRLSEAFWDTLYPKLGTDAEYRMMPFYWANTKLAQKILLYIPLTYAEDEALPLQYYGHYQVYYQQGGGGVARESLGDAANWPEAFHLTDPSYYEMMTQYLTCAQESLQQINTLIVGKLPAYPGCLNALQQQIHRLIQVVEHLMQEKQHAVQTHPEQETTEAAAVPKSSSDVAHPHEYQQLETLVAKLMKQDPHLPAHQLMQQALRWRNLSLKELVSQFPGSEEDNLRLLKMLGLV